MVRERGASGLASRRAGSERAAQAPDRRDGARRANCRAQETRPGAQRGDRRARPGSRGLACARVASWLLVAGCWLLATADHRVERATWNRQLETTNQQPVTSN